MFKLDGKTLPVGVPFTHNEIQYPANWLNLSTPEEKEAIGITEIAVQPRPDDRYYWVTDNGDGTYTTTPKDLVQLKDNQTKQVNATVFSILQPTDYIDARNLRDPSYKPEWIVWRASVVDTGRAAKVAINACETVDDLIRLEATQWPQDPDRVTP